jgi:serine/threonine-protein kinase
VADGGTVTLDVSSGPAQVNVPNVDGLAQSAASSELSSAGFTVSVASGTERSSTVGAGDVLSYSPSGTVTQGSTITLTISAGGGQVTVPKVTGMSKDSAVTELQNQGFKVVTHHVTLLLGTVFNQDPGPGDSAAAGSTVTLYY